MEEYHADVQALLQDIHSNYGEDEPEQRPLLYSRPNSNPYHSRVEPLFDPRQTPASTYSQHWGYVTQASRTLESPSHAPQIAHSNTGFDVYGEPTTSYPLRESAKKCPDRAPLTEPQPQLWQTGDSPPKRISLPGHTAPAASFQMGTVEQRFPYSSQHRQCRRSPWTNWLLMLASRTFSTRLQSTDRQVLLSILDVQSQFFMLSSLYTHSTRPETCELVSSQRTSIKIFVCRQSASYHQTTSAP